MSFSPRLFRLFDPPAFATAPRGGNDGVVLLSVGVAQTPKGEAGGAVGRGGVWVRVSRDDVLDALAALPARPDAVLLAGCADGRTVQEAGAALAVAEAEHGWPDGSVGVVAGPDAAGLLALGSFAGCSARLQGLLLDETLLDDDGAAADVVLRTLVRLGAGAAGVPAFLAPRRDLSAAPPGFAGLLLGA